MACYVLVAFGIAAAVVVSAGIVWYALNLHEVLDEPFDDLCFDQEAWRAQHNSSDPDNPRGKMVADLQRRCLRKGMTRQEVLDLLGEPDFAKEPTLFMYNLGAWSGFRIDYDTLDVHFDTDGRLTHTAVVGH